METLYIEVLTGTLKLPPPEDRKLNYVYKTVNNTLLPLICKMYNAIDDSPLTQGEYIPPRGGVLKQTHKFVGDCQIFTCAATGGLVSARLVADSGTDEKYKNYTTEQDWTDVPVASNVMTTRHGLPGLVELNDIGNPPSPKGHFLLPPDSTKFVVGAGLFELANPKGKNVLLIHEQFWRRSPASFSLAPNSKKSVALVITAGRTETTSSNSNSNKSGHRRFRRVGTNFSEHVCVFGIRNLGQPSSQRHRDITGNG